MADEKRRPSSVYLMFERGDGSKKITVLEIGQHHLDTGIGNAQILVAIQEALSKVGVCTNVGWLDL